MNISRRELASRIEGTEVNLVTTEKDIRALLKLANQYHFATVAPAECYHKLAKDLLEEAGNTETVIVGCCGYPYGTDTTRVKMFQVRNQLATGCKEMDITNNLSWLKSGLYSKMDEELKLLVEACEGVPSKVIIEISLLTPDEIKRVCESAMAAGATFIKTGTGTTGNPTTIEHIQTIKSIVGDTCKVKASGGVRSLKQIEELLAVGADRFGISRPHIMPILDSIPE